MEKSVNELCANLLVPGFDRNPNVKLYLEQLFKFLIEYSWIYDIKLTDLFINRTLEQIPDEWRDALSNLSHEALQQLPFPENGPVQDNLPPSLMQFLNTAASLSLSREIDASIEPVHIPETVKRGMTPKKYHEVSHMSSVIQRVCKESGCSLVLDVGSGLGYLGNVLSERCGLHVLGLESIDDRSNGAVQMTEKNCISSAFVDSVPFRLADSEACFADIEKIIKDKLDNIQQNSHEDVEKKPAGGVCMVGLHCCGSLTPIMLKLIQRPFFMSLVCVSCCYHSIPVNDEGMHDHFPMSRQARHFIKNVQTHQASWRLGTFALRLAAQETRARWFIQKPKDHLYHTKNVAYRGILEAWAKSAAIELKKDTRLIAKKRDFTDFQSYIAAVISRTSLKDHPGVASNLQELHDQYQADFALIEPFTALQVILQPVIESFIVIDRLLYLYESNFICRAIPIFDECLSPRNLAIIVQK